MKFSVRQYIALLLLLSLVGGIIAEITGESDITNDINKITDDKKGKETIPKKQRDYIKPDALNKVEVGSLIVSTSNGLIKGRYRKTRKHVTFASFENIPFARPPVGNLRFKDPLPAEDWELVRDATRRGHECPQLDMHTDKFIGDEDCLVLDVYTPNLNPEASLPVMVHLSGGGFIVASSVRFNNPNLFIQENVILVSINYRLGALGFLSLDTKDVPGNAGMKDQIMALKWIKNNIAAFGGDPDKVTVFGESAGGLSASLLQISDMARGLLHGVISMSSAGLNEWGFDRNQTKTAEEFATSMGLNPESGDLLQQLQSQPAELIVNIYDAPRYLDFTWKVVKEKSFEGVEAFINRWPRESYELGLFNHMPAMIGYDSYEGVSFYNPDIVRLAVTSGHFLVTSKWNLPVGSDLYNETNERVRQFYFGDKKINSEDNETLIHGIELVGDIGFFRDIDESVRTLVRHSKENIFYYRFSYGGEKLAHPAMKKFNLDGASHAAELRFLFEEEVVDENNYDNKIRQKLIKLFTNFAKTGNPTPVKDDPLIPITWSPVTEEVVNFLDIKDNLTLGTDPDNERSKFWRELEEFVRQKNMV